MALTDDQMDALCAYAKQLGEDDVLNDPHDQGIINAVFDWAELEDMRTEDEFNAIVTEDDMPASEDRQAIIQAWEEGYAANQ